MQTLKNQHSLFLLFCYLLEKGRKKIPEIKGNIIICVPGNKSNNNNQLTAIKWYALKHLAHKPTLHFSHFVDGCAGQNLHRLRLHITMKWFMQSYLPLAYSLSVFGRL